MTRLRYSDRRQPVDSWGDIVSALLAGAFLLFVGFAAAMFAVGAWS